MVRRLEAVVVVAAVLAAAAMLGFVMWWRAGILDLAKGRGRADMEAPAPATSTIPEEESPGDSSRPE